MELVQYTFPIKPLTIIPIGDIQWTGRDEDVALHHLQQTIQRGVAEDAWFIGMGDYIDYASPSNRQRLRSAGLYDNAIALHDRTAQDLVEDLYLRVLKPTQGRWLGLLAGHHFYELQAGYTTDMLLATYLDTVFLGDTAYVGLHFWDERQRRGGTVNVWASHGCGSTTYAAGQLIKLDKILPDWEADIFLLGHQTKMAAAPVNRIYPVWPERSDSVQPPRLCHRTKLIVGTGGYGKSYIEGSKQGIVPRGTYVEKALMRPAVLGSPIVRVRPRLVSVTVDRQKRTQFTVDMSVELGD